MSSMYYQVDIYKGRIGEQTKESVQFENEDIKAARAEALRYAWQVKLKREGKFDDPTFITDTPVLIPMLEAFSIDVWFMMDGEGSERIYGDDVHCNLSGLSTEAYLYVQSGLIKREELVEIYENTDDEAEPAFLYASEGNKPDFDYGIVRVLPYDVEVILGQIVPS